MNETHGDESPASGSGGEGLGAAELAAAFAAHRDRLWRMVRVRIDHRLLGRVDPDDILQEAFLEATRRLEHFQRDGTSSVFLWLRLVVGQTLVDAHRRHLGAQQRDVRREVSIHQAARREASSAALAGALIANLSTPSKAVMRAEMAQTLETALEGMAPIDREVLILRHFEELTNNEVAEVLGLQPKAASIRYVRAVARLKGILEQFPEFTDESHP
jgi:RNA polymerase sigma-70 factor, ECF subfamily